MLEDTNFGELNYCLSEEDLLSYVSGDLSRKRRYEIELHLEECELCREAVEGFEQMEFPLYYPEIRDELTKKWQEAIDGNSVPRFVFPWRIAAAFALIALSMTLLYFILPNRPEKQFSEAFEPYPAQPIEEPALQEKPEPTPSTEEEAMQPKPSIPPVTDSKSSDLAEKNSPVSNSEAADFTNEVSATDQSSAGEPESFAQETPAAATSGNTQTESKAESDHTVRTTQAEETKATKKSSAEISGKPSTTLSPEISLYNQALGLYQSGRYSESLAMLESITNIPEARFYGGLCALSLNDAPKALSEFKKFEKQAGKKMQEERLWYEALAHLKLNENADAKKKLQAVVKLNGPYREKANQLLNKID